MKLPRRQFLHLAVGACGLPALSRAASAEAYPTRPVHLIVGTPAGGGMDIVARPMGRWLSERLGQTFVIDNRPGAATNIATELVARASADGYTLLFVTALNAANVTLYDNLNFNFIQDITPIASIDRLPFVVQLNPSVPAKTVPEFIAYAKANPGKINFASGGIGSTQHVAGELFNMMAGVKMVHVPYRGEAPALTDLLGGQVQVYFGPIASSIGHIRAGQLRALAVTTETRLELLPEIPTMGEFVSGYEASGWQGIGAPRNTPAEIIEKLNRAINAALADREMKARLADLGATILVGSPTDFGKLIANETEKWAKVIKFANIKPE
jgi:tripartite-type tricarboxylate transporter receptor subunit TctC